MKYLNKKKTRIKAFESYKIDLMYAVIAILVHIIIRSKTYIPL